MPIKYFGLIIVAFISWNLIPNSASSTPSRYSDFVKKTAETIAKNNQLTNEFQNQLFLLHEEEVFLEATKDLETYHNILKPPNIAYRITDDNYNAELYTKCMKEIQVLESEPKFKNLSSVCLKQRLDKQFADYTLKLSQISTDNAEYKEFLRKKVSEANRVSVDFYTENYSAYILHSQYDQIKKELETMNSKLYDVFMEVKHYPNKLPNATTTSCT